MGQQGDLLLVFADHLTRSWKQIIKFRPAGSPEPTPAQAPAPVTQLISEPADEEPALASLEGLIRDERGVHFAPETED
jgi:cyanophycin synthetase